MELVYPGAYFNTRTSEDGECLKLLSSGVFGHLSFFPVLKRVRGKFFHIFSPKASEGFGCLDLKLHSSLEYFYGKNPSKIPKSYREKDLFCFSNIIIDIDYHGNQMMMHTTKESADLFLGDISYFFEDLGYTAPNAAIATGRGYHLIWHFDSIAKSLSSVYDAVTLAYCNLVSDYLKTRTDCYRLLSVDFASSTKKQGIYRLPGSTNRKSGVVARASVRSTIPLRILEEAEKCSAPSKPRFIALSQKKEQQALGESRVAFLEYLAKERKGICEGSRASFLFCYLQSLILAGECSDIYAAAEQVNEAFLFPALPPSEVRAIARGCEKKTYKLSNKYIIKTLDITEIERKKIGLGVPTTTRNTNKARSERSSKKKSLRDSKIISYFKEGVKKAEIARKLKISRTTVDVVLKNAGLYVHCAKKTFKERIRDFFMRALSLKEKFAPYRMLFEPSHISKVKKLSPKTYIRPVFSFRSGP